MEISGSVGTLAAICTTGAFIPQIVKIRKQGGEDLSYAMLAVYFAGVSLWLIYGVILHAAAIIWANAITALLVGVAVALKAMHQGRERAENRGASAGAATESEFAGD